MRKMLIAGHRGNPVDYAENTMPSFQSAVDLGVDMIETDIHMTKDGNLVLIHDPSLDRNTDGHGLVQMCIRDRRRGHNHVDAGFARRQRPRKHRGGMCFNHHAGR